MSDNPRSPRGGAQTRAASERTPSSLEVPSKLRSTTTTHDVPAGAAAARASGGGALPFASGGELPDDPPVPPAAAPEVDAAPTAVGGARGRRRRVRTSWVKKSHAVLPNASARRDSLGSDGVSHRPVLVPRPPLLGDEARAPPSEETDDRRRRVGDFLPEGYETDACFFVDLYEDLEGIVDPAFQRAHDALEEYYDRVKAATSDVIPWAPKDKKRYLCRNPQGIVCAHYSPYEEAGRVTNVGINVHLSASAKDEERTRAKQKAACLRFQSQAIASETAELGDGYTVTRVVEPVEGVPGATVERFVAVENSSAALLHFDVFERWPCVKANDVDIEDAVRKRLGRNALEEGDDLFANLIQARRLYVAKKGGGQPPVMVWNRGTMDGERFGGAQLGTFEALKITCGEENVWSTYHMAFLMRKSPATKVAASYADAAMRGFISRARLGALTFPKTRRDGYWAFYHEIAEMTDEERRLMREEFLAFMRELRKRGRKIVSDAWEAFTAGEADDTQRAIVEAMMEALAKGRKTISDAWEAFKDGKADDAQRAIVEAMMEGSKTVADAWEAFKDGKADDAQRAIVEAMMEGSKTVADAWEAFKDGKADDAQRAIVEAMMEGLEKGRKTVADALEAVRYDFENGTTTATEEQHDIAQRVFAPRMKRWGKNPAEIIIWRNQDAALAALAALEPGTGGSVPTRVPGFVNLGNTCYLAATAQMLCGLGAFAGDLVALPDASSPGAHGFGSAFEGAAGADARGAPSPGSLGGVAGALRDLVREREDHASRFDNPETRASATASLDPSQLKEAMQSRHEQYKGTEQHDAHEFLCHTLEAVSQEVVDARANGFSIARSPTCRFEGAFTETLTCVTCGRRTSPSTESETFRWLSLDLPEYDAGSDEPLELQRLLTQCFASETVERRCERAGCGGTSAEKAPLLLRAPEALLVHLKRSRAEGKNSRKVELPTTVTLAPRDGVSTAADPDSPADEAAAASTRMCAEDDSAAGEAARSQLASYRLAGFVSHFGDSTNEGHYVASARVDVGGETTGKCWMSFNDKTVRVVESPAYAESTPKDWYLAVFEYAPDSGENVADAAFPARAAAPTKTKGGAKLKNPAQGECASEPDAFKFGTIGDACMYLLEDAGADGLSLSTLAQEIQKRKLAKLGGKTPSNTVAYRLGQDKRFVRVAPGVYALAKHKDHLFSALAAQDWVREAYLGDGNGDFVPGDGEDDVEFLTLKARLTRDGYQAIFHVYGMRAAMSPRSLYADVYNCLRNECDFFTVSGRVIGCLPVGTNTRASSKVVTFLKSFLYKVRKLSDADVNAKNAAAAAEKKKKKKKAKKRAR